jgi:hypothetical protein
MRQLAAVVLALILLTGCSASPISVGTLAECRDFGAFQASAPDPEEARRTEALVQAVLSEYPQGFPEQWGRVEILLVGELTGQEQFSGGSFAGFTQRTGDGWLMVLDAGRCDAGTVHHEIAHILDGILTEAGALTEEEWLSFCPGGFAYGQGDFAEYPDFFADTYAMENLKEDRARTFEDAILYGAGVYADRPALWLKLEYLSRAIRAHFDTTGWPEKTAWEQALERIN